MADITDPQAIAFTNHVRSIAEKMRALDAVIDSSIVDWFNGISELIPNDSSPIDDGREAEGVSRLVGSDVVNLITQMLAYQTQLDQSGVAGVIALPCVRPLEVI